MGDKVDNNKNIFWSSYKAELDSGYYRKIDGKECMKEELIVEYQKKIVKFLKYDCRDKRTEKNKNRNKLSQLWKFYDHARRIQDSLRLKNEPLDVMKADLYELSSAANYAFVRDTITTDFKKFIDLNVAHIKNDNDLRAFIKHFQSLIAYLPKENQK